MVGKKKVSTFATANEKQTLLTMSGASDSEAKLKKEFFERFT